MEKRRYIEFDIMRILACFGVIMIHAAVFNQETLYAHNTWEHQAIYFWGVLSRWAVPAFVMLSGMMILLKAEEISLKKLLLHPVRYLTFICESWEYKPFGKEYAF